MGDDPKSWSEQLENYINGKIRRGQNVSFLSEDGQLFTLTGDTAGKVSSMYNNDGTIMKKAEFERKISAGSRIDELVQVAKGGGDPVPDFGGKHGKKASGGWIYPNAYFLDEDGKYYKCTISTMIGSDGKVAYNVGKMEERSFPDVSGSSTANSGADVQEASYTNSIPETSRKSNPQFSLKKNTDNQGRDLSAEQAEYFKDSKVRDKDGNLLVMYHQTEGDFTVFDRKKSKYSNL